MIDERDREILEEVARRFGSRATPTLEDLLTSPDCFGLTTASPLQRAICRVVEGRPLGELATHPHVLSAIGHVPLGMGRPQEVVVLSGIRTAKSLTAAALGVYASQTCDLSRLGAGEIARVSIVSLKLDLAHVVHQHLVGNVLAKPRLRELLLDEPTADSVLLRHPSGRPVEIKVVAGSRAGATLVARWSAGNVFDEAPRMIGAEDGVVNLDDLRAAVLGRLLPGAQALYVGSPWAPFGPIWRMVQEGFQRPSATLTVVKAPAPWMNPVWWTPERCERLRKEDPDVYRTDVEAEFHDPEQTLYPLALLEAATRPSPIMREPEPGHQYVAAMDPATRGNAWTLAIATLRAGRKAVVYTRQWIGSQAAPLSPDAVLAEIAAILRRYNVGMAETDQYAGDAMRDIARRHGLYLVVRDWTAATKVDVFTRLKTELADNRVELPPDPQVLADLQGVRRKITQTGVSIELRKTSDGRHCDYAPAIALAISKYFVQAEEQPPAWGTPERADWDDRQREDEDDARYVAEQSRPWWAR